MLMILVGNVVGRKDQSHEKNDCNNHPMLIDSTHLFFKCVVCTTCMEIIVSLKNLLFQLSLNLGHHSVSLKFLLSRTNQHA